MEEGVSPINLYLKSIFSQLDIDPVKKFQYFKQFEKNIIDQNQKLNYDSIHPAIYILLILIGKKIRNANAELKIN